MRDYVFIASDENEQLQQNVDCFIEADHSFSELLAAIKEGYLDYVSEVDAEDKAMADSDLAATRYYEGVGRMDATHFENQMDLERHDAEFPNGYC